MAPSIWHRESCGPGREYMLGKDIHTKYENEEQIVSTILEGLREFVKSEPAVRISLDTPKSNSERAILAIPLAADEDTILLNFAILFYHTLMGYYFSGDPKSSHFGITNLLIEGKMNSLLRRELEKLFYQFQTRPDMAGRLLKNVKLVPKKAVPKPGKSIMIETIRAGIDIHVGYRIHALGDNINHGQIFIPMVVGEEIIEQIYFNLEQMLHVNFVTYDETGDGYLTLSDTLIFRELENILVRARDKVNTRKKVLNNIQFNTIFTKNPELEHGIPLGDDFYDQINNIQDEKIKAASESSNRLYASYLLKTTAISLKGVKTDYVLEDVETDKSASKPKKKAELTEEGAKVEPPEDVKAELAGEEGTPIKVPAPDEAALKNTKVELKQEKLQELKK
ncbi:MAG: hypothetical protein OEY59_03450 [Deltaproteobacteria bacterium]|nr:hypothetical protein [Deltaproteobacteria bacterium]